MLRDVFTNRGKLVFLSGLVSFVFLVTGYFFYRAMSEPRSVQAVIEELHSYNPSYVEWQYGGRGREGSIPKSVLELIRLGESGGAALIEDYKRLLSNNRVEPWYFNRAAMVLCGIGSDVTISFLRDRLLEGSRAEVQDLTTGMNIYLPGDGEADLRLVDCIVSAIQRCRIEEGHWKGIASMEFETLRLLTGFSYDLDRIKNSPIEEYARVAGWWEKTRDEMRWDHTQRRFVLRSNAHKDDPK